MRHPALLGLLVLAACAAPAAGQAEAETGAGADTETDGPQRAGSAAPRDLARLARSLDTEASCVAEGGVWGRGGLAPEPFCNMRYPDAGAACTGADACGGRCIARPEGPDPDTDPDTDPDMGAPATGRCQTYTSQFGCYGLVEDGTLGPTLCVD